MKKTVLSLIFALLSFALSAKGTWTLQGDSYEVDTLYHAKVGPGTTQTSIALSGSLDLRIFYTTTDITDPNVEMRVVKAKNKILAMATVPNMATTNTKEGELYFAGVNADFFDMSTGQPIGTNVINSEIYNLSGNANWTEISFDASENPHIGDLTFSGNVRKGDGTSYEISTINSGRLEDYLVLFSDKFGSSTGTNPWGIEVVVQPIETNATIALGKSVKMKIVGTPATAGNMAIPVGSYVLSGHGAAKTFIETLVDGDEIEVSLVATNANGEPVNPKWAVGGCPILLKDGIVQDTENANIISHLPNKEPRTAIGYDSTGTKIIMMIVDGRSTVSDGCRTKILADIMREAGCSDAMNFDGGGSSTLYVKNLGNAGVVNVPSQGALRAVTNGVYAVATVPTDTEIAEIQFVDWVKELPKYGYYTPKFYGYNKYGVLVETDLQGVELSCPSELGEIVDDGKTLSASGSGSHKLTGKYKGVETSLVVRVESTTPRFRLSGVTLDKPGEYQVEILSTLNGEEVSLNGRCFQWTSSDESVATVDESGLIRIIQEGMSVIRGSVGDYVGEMTVRLEQPTSRYRRLDYGLEETDWQISGELISESSMIEQIGEGEYSLQFTPTSTRKVFASMSKELYSWSRPDSLSIEINPVTPTIRYVYLQAEDQTRPVEPIEYKYQVSGMESGTYTKVLLPMNEIVDMSDIGCYPLKITGIRFGFLTITKDVLHRIDVKDIKWVYNSVSSEQSGVESLSKEKVAGVLLTPNPVEMGETVKLNTIESVDYSVYSVSGSLVRQGIGKEIETMGMSSGVYIVTIRTGEGNKTAKLIVK